MNKNELRSYYKKLRREASSREADLKITERLANDPRILNADTVLLYASFGSEPSTWFLASILFEKNIGAAYPKCGEDGKMDFYRISSTDDMHIGRFGIAEPDGCVTTFTDITEKTVCIVPALAFTEKGERLGMGGGYYDRFLAKHPDLYTIGIAYEACIADELPTDMYDVKVRSIVTEERMVLCDE